MTGVAPSRIRLSFHLPRILAFISFYSLNERTESLELCNIGLRPDDSVKKRNLDISQFLDAGPSIGPHLVTERQPLIHALMTDISDALVFFRHEADL